MRRAVPHLSARTGAVVSLALTAALLFPVAAFGWTFEQDLGGGLLVVRESGDATTNVGVTLYYDYKGGSETSTTYALTSNASYRLFKQMPNVTATQTLIVPIQGYRIQRLTLWNTQPPGQQWTDRTFVNASALVMSGNADAPISVVGTVAVAGTPRVSLAGTPTVRMDGTATVSLGSTLPVDPWSTANLPTDWQVAVVALLILWLAVHAGLKLAERGRTNANAG